MPKRKTVVTGDGTKLESLSWGAGENAIVLIHGFCQGVHVWQRQETITWRGKVVAYDLRGHAASSKPEECNYQDPSLWANDLETILEHHQINRALLVGWSWGGRVVLDYMQTKNTDKIAGLVFVGATLRTTKQTFGPGTSHKKGMLSNDMTTSRKATTAFTEDMFVAPGRHLKKWVAQSMKTPPHVRQAMDGRKLDSTTWASKCNLPVWIAHGQQDKMIITASGRHAAKTFPNSRLSIFQQSGHCPFWEQHSEFNKELKSFADAAFGRQKTS